MGFTAMAFLWTGSQIPVYLFGEPEASEASFYTSPLLTVLFCRWYTALYLQRHRGRGSVDLVCE